MKGQEVTQLCLIYNGVANVYFDETYDADIGDGSFLGELSFSLFEKANTDVTIKEKSRLIYWNQDDLWDLLERNPSMRVHFAENNIRRFETEDGDVDQSLFKARLRSRLAI